MRSATRARGRSYGSRAIDVCTRPVEPPVRYSKRGVLCDCRNELTYAEPHWFSMAPSGRAIPLHADGPLLAADARRRPDWRMVLPTRWSFRCDPARSGRRLSDTTAAVGEAGPQRGRNDLARHTANRSECTMVARLPSPNGPMTRRRGGNEAPAAEGVRGHTRARTRTARSFPQLSAAARLGVAPPGARRGAGRLAGSVEGSRLLRSRREVSTTPAHANGGVHDAPTGPAPARAFRAPAPCPALESDRQP